ncbi:hypothetical protein [Actinomadura nitritigenes]|uniref:hypothetical protein n=1 Tax=Actinomadura nitritigenes TaxID=134602 RepID=UPI003D8C8043
MSAASAAVRRGVGFGLSVPADENGPYGSPYGGRFNPIHTMTRYRGDNALAHLWYDDLLYNGYHHDDAVTAWSAERCSIQNLTAGVVSRGVRLDIPGRRGWRRGRHRPLPGENDHAPGVDRSATDPVRTCFS